MTFDLDPKLFFRKKARNKVVMVARVAGRQWDEGGDEGSRWAVVLAGSREAEIGGRIRIYLSPFSYVKENQPVLDFAGLDGLVAYCADGLCGL